MNGRVVPALLVSLIACKGSDSKCPEPKPAPAPAPAQKEVADTDPDFTHVDRDQLAALCLAARLPPVTYPSDHGALALADGKRVPWLTVWVDTEAPTDVPALSAKQWTSRAGDYIKSAMSRIDGPRPEPSRTGREWRNLPCDGDEVFDVVTTGVVFEKKSFHAFAMRGDKLVQEELPATTAREAVFHKALELTEKLVGGPVTIAGHKFFGKGEESKTVTTDVWVAATK